jgi:hypothetical protein
MNNTKSEYKLGFGNNLGNINIDKIYQSGSYFLGKKDSYALIEGTNKPIMKLKGVPNKIIDIGSGQEVVLNIDIWKNRFNGLDQTIQYITLEKHIDFIDNKETNIKSKLKSMTLKAKNYKEFNY